MTKSSAAKNEKTRSVRRGQREKKAKSSSIYVFGQKDVDQCIKNITESQKPLKKRASATINGQSLEGEKRTEALDSAMQMLRKPIDTQGDVPEQCSSQENNSQKDPTSTSDQSANSYKYDTDDAHKTGDKEKVAESPICTPEGQAVSGSTTGNLPTNACAADNSDKTSSVNTAADSVTQKQCTDNIPISTHIPISAPTTQTHQSQIQYDLNKANTKCTEQQTSQEMPTSQHNYSPYTNQQSNQSTMSQYNDYTQRQMLQGSFYDPNIQDNNTRYMQGLQGYDSASFANTRYRQDNGVGDQCHDGYRFNISKPQNDTSGRMYSGNFDRYAETQMYNDVSATGTLSNSNNGWSRFPTSNNFVPPNFPTSRFNHPMHQQQRPPFNTNRFPPPDMNGIGTNVRHPYDDNNFYDPRSHSHSDSSSMYSASQTVQSGANDTSERQDSQLKSTMTGRFVKLDEIVDFPKDFNNARNTIANHNKFPHASDTVTASASLGSTATEVARAQAMMSSPVLMEIGENSQATCTYPSNDGEDDMFDISGLDPMESTNLADTIIDVASNVPGDSSGSVQEYPDKTAESSECSAADSMVLTLESGKDIVSKDKSSGAISKSSSTAKPKKKITSKTSKTNKAGKKNTDKNKCKKSQSKKKNTTESSLTSGEIRSDSDNGTKSTILEDMKPMVIRVKEDAGKVCDDKDAQLENNTKNIEMLTRMLEGLHLVIQQIMTRDERENARNNIVWSVDSLLGLTAEDYFPLGRLKVVVRGLYNKGELIGHTAMGKGRKKPPVPKDERWEILQKCCEELELPQGKHVDAVNAVCRQKTQEFKGYPVDEEASSSEDNFSDTEDTQ